MDRLDELGVLVAIADNGSLAGAARALRRSPPAITRALAELEARAGARLVERTTRRLALTQAGRDLAEHGRRMLAEYDLAIGDAAAHAVRGLLRVTAPVVFGRRHVTPVVTSFLETHPEVQVELVLHDRNLDLIEEDLHVAVRIGPLADSGLIVRRLGSVGRLLVASPAYLARHGMPQTPGDLHAHHTILTGGQEVAAGWRFGPDARGAAIRLSPRLIVSDIEAMLAAARDGHGIARPLSYQVASELAEGALVRLLSAFEPPPLPVQLAFAGGRHMPAKLRAFLDHAVAKLGDLAVIRDGPAVAPTGQDPNPIRRRPPCPN